MFFTVHMYMAKNMAALSTLSKNKRHLVWDINELMIYLAGFTNFSVFYNH